jgi:hypothetical protein
MNLDVENMDRFYVCALRLVPLSEKSQVIVATRVTGSLRNSGE